jgi:hypothetical protein
LPNSKNSKNQEKNFDSSSTSENDSKTSAEMFSFDKVCGVAQTITNSKATGKVLTIKEELALYISMKSQYSDLTVFWRENEQKLPKLSSLMRKDCMIQASSVASESAFSIANYVKRKERSALSAESLRYSMFLREKLIIEKLFLDYKNS